MFENYDFTKKNLDKKNFKQACYRKFKICKHSDFL